MPLDRLADPRKAEALRPTRLLDRGSWHWAHLSVLVILGVSIPTAIFLAFARLGFNPTDQGYVLSQSNRILHGSIPHSDLISPRPLGSAFLHTLNFLIPLPMLEADRLVTVIEITAYCSLLSWLVFGEPPTRWRVWQVGLTICSILLSLNTFPLTSWHTIDGILFSSAGLLVLTNGLVQGRSRSTKGGLVLLGAALLMKQNFVLVAIIGSLAVAVRPGSIQRRAGEDSRQLRRGYRLRAATAALAWAALPGAIYLLVLACAGGLEAAITQLTQVQGASATGLINQLFRSGVVLQAIIVAVMIEVADRWRSRRPHSQPAQLMSLLLRSGATALVVWVALRGQLTTGGAWSVQLMACAVIVVLWHAALRRVVDLRAVAVLLVAYTASLSWGLTAPSLAAGSLATVILFGIWRDAGGDVKLRWRTILNVMSGLMVTACVIACAVVFTSARRSDIYREQAASSLHFRLSTVSPRFGSVLVDSTTGRYIADVKACIDSHPAGRVAILPDNPGLYPLLDVKNPFPIDWMYPPEYQGSVKRLNQEAERLRYEGNYFVMFQIQPVLDIAMTRLLPANASSVPFGYDPVPITILHTLGRTGTCGPFIVAYDPSNRPR